MMKYRLLIPVLALLAAVSCSDARKPLVGITSGWSGERITVKDAILLDTRGISSMYANDGGVIVVI